MICRTSISDKLYSADAFRNESIPRCSSVWTLKVTCSEYQPLKQAFGDIGTISPIHERVEKEGLLVKNPSIDLSSAFIEIRKLKGIPEVVVKVFEGDPVEFRYFTTTFENVVESRVSDQKSRLT